MKTQEIQKTLRELELEWEEKYGGMASTAYDSAVSGSLGRKLDDYNSRMTQGEVEGAEKPTYPQIVRALSEASSKISKLANVPECMVEEKRKALNKEFDRELKKERDPRYKNSLEYQRGEWVNAKLLKYIRNDPAYLNIKAEQKQAVNDYSVNVALKDKWEKAHNDIIQAEKARSARAELMQADSETLRALGIAPDPTYTAPSTEVPSNVSEGSYLHLEQGYVDALIRARASEMLAEQKKASEG